MSAYPLKYHSRLLVLADLSQCDGPWPLSDFESTELLGDSFVIVSCLYESLQVDQHVESPFWTTMFLDPIHYDQFRHNALDDYGLLHVCNDCRYPGIILDEPPSKSERQRTQVDPLGTIHNSSTTSDYLSD